MKSDEIVRQILAGQTVTDEDLGLARECPPYTLMALAARRGQKIIDSPQASELLKSLISWCPRKAGFTNDGPALVKLFKAVPAFAEYFYGSALERNYRLPAEVIRWFRCRIIEDGSVMKVEPCDGYMAGAELFLCLAENPTSEQVEYVCKYAWRQNKTYSWKNEIVYSIKGLVDIFDALSPAALELVSDCLGKIDAEKVYEAIVQSKRSDDAARAKAVMTLSPVDSDVVFTRPFAVPRGIFGKDLLKLLFKLSFLAGGKEYITGLPSKDEIRTRMVELILLQDPHGAECIKEACKLRDELARSIGRAVKARQKKEKTLMEKAA